jgi:hypothetical protein
VIDESRLEKCKTGKRTPGDFTKNFGTNLNTGIAFEYILIAK